MAAMGLGACALQPLAAGDRAFEASAAWIGGRPAVAWYGGRQAHEAIFLRHAGHVLQLTDASRDAYEPSLQELDGDALVAWYEQEPAERGLPRSRLAMLARFDVSGRRLWQRQLSAPDASGRNPVVRVSGNVIHAAWLEQRGAAAPVLRVARLDGAGAWLVPPRDAAVAGVDTWNLNAAAGADGVFHVLFDKELGGRANELHWMRVSGDQLEELGVSQDDGFDSVYPDIAIDGPRFAVTWFDSRAGNPEVHLRCGELGAAGALPSPLMLDDAQARRVTHTTAESVGAYLAWHEGHIELAWIEADRGRSELWRQRFDGNCRPLGPPMAVAGHGRQAGIPSLAASPDGLLLAWNSQRAGAAVAMRGEGRGASSTVLMKVWPGRRVSPNAAAR